MNVVESVITKLEKLPPEKQQQVLEYVEGLEGDAATPATPRKSSYGLWKKWGVDITEEDIAEARREMWGNVPRDDV